jgi:OmpA family protein
MGETIMMATARIITVALVCVVVAAAPAAGEVFVYPKQGQNQEKFEKDQFECHNWAKQQTGVDPSQPMPAAAPPPPQTGGAVRGGARGAAVGAIGGAIGGDAGKGAAIGAGVGAVAGGMRQRAANEQAAATSQQAMAQQQQGLQRYDQAYGTCMGGRNYQVQMK